MKVHRKCSFLLPACLIFIIGCAPGVQKPLPICPGSGSVEHALDILRQHSGNMLPFMSKGQCRLRYSDDGDKRTYNLKVTVLVKSSQDIYLQADTSLVSKVVILGSNKEEFWLALRPNEISEYWSGQWSQLNSDDSLLLNPGTSFEALLSFLLNHRTLLEVLGVADIDLQADWSLSNEGPFDILTKRENGRIVKKIYIFCCENSIRKIEYFDADGRKLIVAELDEYMAIAENFSVPQRIKITTAVQNKKEDSISLVMELGSVEARQMTEKQDILFQPAPMGGFKNIYRLTNRRWIKQSQ